MRTALAKRIIIFVLMIMTDFTGLKWEDSDMQIIYQLAKRSVVRIEVKEFAGNGVIWKIDDDNVIICSNRHLLMHDVEAEVTFCDKEKVKAQILGYSQQYDLGFLKINISELPTGVFRDIYEVVPVIYDFYKEEDIDEFLKEYENKTILQLGAGALNDDKYYLNTGTVDSVRFEPVFNTKVIVTCCYSKAGMSGSGLFDEGGRFLGIVSGGDVSDDASEKESDYTFSIPSSIILDEYDIILEEKELH